MDDKSEVASVIVQSDNFVKSNADFNFSGPEAFGMSQSHMPQPELASILKKKSKKLTHWERQKLIEASKHCQACKIKYR
jgi:hypothetical protein